MTNTQVKYERRHSRWYERLIFSTLFQFILGYFIVVLMPNTLYWGEFPLLALWDNINLRNTFLINSAAFIISYLILNKFKQFPGTRSLAFILPTITISWFSIFTLFFLFAHDSPYQRDIYIYSFVLASICSFIGFFVEQHYQKMKLAIVPFGRALELDNSPYAHTSVLTIPDLAECRYNGIVADLHAKELPAQWQTFLAECTLAHIPVFHVQQITESLTGRVKINHLSENSLGTLLPSGFYSGVKRVIETIAAILLLPLLVPIMLITAIIIKVDSPGTIFFNQERMGYRGRTFKMYKFRSMRSDMEGKGFTVGEDDPRITRFGKLIRKFRIDELPQVLNVIKGDMSFIGPRPESLKLSQWYGKDVPFFQYRHIVRPGISGWAQVNQGYAAEVEGMIEKLEYDFYYIKHYSLWLDLLIVVKTIKTMLTGFGAR